MNDYKNRLTNFLLEKNQYISYHQAKICVRILWRDMEEIYYYPYRNTNLKVVEQRIREWIDEYEDVVHEFVNHSPKFNYLYAVEYRFLH